MTNTFCAAPVHVCKRHLLINNGIRALIVNTGCANAGTGEQGLRDAETTCGELANLLNITDSQVLPFSTGVILEHLPMDKLIGGLGFGPRFLVSIDGLRATGLLQPGSLVRWIYRVRLAGNDADDKAATALADDARAALPERQALQEAPQPEEGAQRQAAAFPVAQGQSLVGRLRVPEVRELVPQPLPESPTAAWSVPGAGNKNVFVSRKIPSC